MHNRLLSPENYEVEDGRPEYLHGKDSPREGKRVLQDLEIMHKLLLDLKQMLHFQKMKGILEKQ